MVLSFLSLTLVVSVWNFQGNIWSFVSTSQADSTFAARADEALNSAKEKEYVFFGVGWEGEVTWLAFQANGLNYLAKTPYDPKLVNIFSAVDFVAHEPEGSSRSWLCASRQVLNSQEKKLGLLNVSGARQAPLSGLRTVISEDNLISYQELWTRAYVVTESGIVMPDLDFLATQCGVEP